MNNYMAMLGLLFITTCVSSRLSLWIYGKPKKTEGNKRRLLKRLHEVTSHWIAVIVAAPIIEESMFRAPIIFIAGYSTPLARVATVAGSFVFAMVHRRNLHGPGPAPALRRMLDHLSWAVVLGLWAATSDFSGFATFWLCVLAHGLWNGGIVLIVWAWRSRRRRAKVDTYRAAA